MELRMSVELPARAESVPMMRHLLRSALERSGVDEETRADLLLALTEACSNVVRHAGDVDSFSVDVTVGAGSCCIEVADAGRGFDALRRGAASGEPATSGRGIELIDALVDRADIRSSPGRGTVVVLEQATRRTSPELARLRRRPAGYRGQGLHPVARRLATGAGTQEAKGAGLSCGDAERAATSSFRPRSMPDAARRAVAALDSHATS